MKYSILMVIDCLNMGHPSIVCFYNTYCWASAHPFRCLRIHLNEDDCTYPTLWPPVNDYTTSVLYAKCYDIRKTLFGPISLRPMKLGHQPDLHFPPSAFGKCLKRFNFPKLQFLRSKRENNENEKRLDQSP